MGRPSTPERDDAPHDASPAWAERCYAYHELYRARLAQNRQRLHMVDIESSTIALAPYSERLAHARWAGFSIEEDASGGGGGDPQRPMTPEVYAGAYVSYMVSCSACCFARPARGLIPTVKGVAVRQPCCTKRACGRRKGCVQRGSCERRRRRQSKARTRSPRLSPVRAPHLVSHCSPVSLVLECPVFSWITN